MAIDAFRSLARDIAPDLEMSGPRGFDMVFADEAVSARVSLAPDDRTVLTDLHVHDVSAFVGPVRATPTRAVLAMNASAVRMSDVSVGIDIRSVLVGRRALSGLSAASFGDALAFWLAQAVAPRDLATARISASRIRAFPGRRSPA